MNQDAGADQRSSAFNSDITPRANELTAVIHPDKFDEMPADISSECDRQRWRKFRVAYHGAQRLAEHTEFPLQLDIELNSTCNLRCPFCTHGHMKVQPELLSFDDYKRIIDEGERYGLCSVKMNNTNEPLLNRDLPEHVRYAKQHGVLNVYFATNGVMLNPAIALRLIEAGVNKVMVSLDAATPQTYAFMRSSNQYELVVKNIRALIALRNEMGRRNPFVRVNFLKTAQNIHEAELFVEQWEGVADMIGFQQQVAMPGVEADIFTQYAAASQEPPAFRCSLPYKLLAIDAAGHILPCCTFSAREMPLGNIHSMTLKEAWDSRQMAILKTAHRAGRYFENKICFHCVHGKDGSQ
jgi:radical SAM protein with 4Fe4S-binding SPASM domain